MAVPVNQRDRDGEGRPRSARPRDAYGRPLPRGAEGVPTTPDDLLLGPEETLREARRLLDEDRPFHAHEVLEARWKSCPDEERDLWRALAQLAVGKTHESRGNEKGSAALFQRARESLSTYEGPSYVLDLQETIRRTDLCLRAG